MKPCRVVFVYCWKHARRLQRDMCGRRNIGVRRILSTTLCGRPYSAASHCCLSVTVKQSAYMIIPWYTTPQGTGCLLREVSPRIRYFASHITAVKIKTPSIAIRDHDFSGGVSASAAEQNFVSASAQKRSRPRPHITDSEKGADGTVVCIRS